MRIIDASDDKQYFFSWVAKDGRIMYLRRPHFFRIPYDKQELIQALSCSPELQ